jgi:hypothetical protein
MDVPDFFEQHKGEYELLINRRPEFRIVVEAYARNGASWERVERGVHEHQTGFDHIAPDFLEEVEDMCDFLHAWPVVIGDHIVFSPIPGKPLEDLAREQLAATYRAISQGRGIALRAAANPAAQDVGKRYRADRQEHIQAMKKQIT